jgi:hypothetical protein
MSDVNDFLFGGGGKAAKFDNIGDYVEGTIHDVRMTQQSEGSDPLFWQDGSPQLTGDHLSTA